MKHLFALSVLLTILLFCPAAFAQSVSEVEPNNTVAEANASPVQITSETVITGSVSAPGDLDLFRVTMPSTKVVRFETFTASGGTDCDTATTTLRLLDSAATQIVTDNASGIRSCSAIAIELPAGTYYIQLEETGNNAAIASYFLRVTFPANAGAEVEPNETSGTANAVATAAPLHILGGVFPVGDSDFYSIAVPAGKSIKIEIIEGDRAVKTCELNTMDSRLTLYNSAAVQLVDDDDDGRGFCSQIDGRGGSPQDAGAANLPAGNYFIQVRASASAAAGSSTFPYRLVVEFGAAIPQPIPTEVEPNGTTAQADASPVQVSSVANIIGTISPVADIDIFRVNLAATKVVRFEIFTVLDGTDCDSSTVVLRLLNSSGTQIISDNGSGIRLCSTIAMELPAGVYYIQAEESGNNATVASYALRVSFPGDAGSEIEPNETTATANSLGAAVPLQVFGTVPILGDSDFYSLTVPGGKSLRIEIVEGDRAGETCESNGIDSQLIVYTAGGVQIVSDDDDGRGFCSQIDGRGEIPLDAAAANLPAGNYFIQVKASPSASGTGTVFSYRMLVEFAPAPVSASVRRSPFDFDGDSRTDIGIFRPTGAQGPGASEWWVQRSTAGLLATQFGQSTDRIVAADYTGDGKSDVAVWRPSTGFWFVLRSEDLTFFALPFGSTGDIPVPGDYDGDNKADTAVFRPSNNTWFIQKSSGGTTIQAFGANGDKPYPADYDGDGKTDIAIWRAAGATGAEFWMQRSTAGLFATQFGTASDKPVPGDYTGDGKADIAFWRPSNGQWFILRSENLTFFAFPFGSDGDQPVPGDYDGDGKYDAGVFRPSSSTWFISGSTAGLLISTFGAAGDVPVPGANQP